MASISLMAVAQEPLRSGLDRTDFDTTVRPGDDFYEYACGGWVKKHPLPAAYSRYGSFDQLQESNDKRINGILTELQNGVYENGTITEVGYTRRDELSKHTLGNRPEFIIDSNGNGFYLKHMYDVFDKVRHEGEFPLDGFVVKPGAMYRLQDGGRTRQEDCVAIKFLPEIVDAELIDVEWNVGKTGEYYPTGILADVILGGKKVNRVSLSNYGKIVEEGIGIGSHLKISLAGDIIPFVYQVVSGGEYPVPIPEDSYVDGVHLMKTMSDEDKLYIRFINSVNVIKPDGIGEKVAVKLFDILPTGNIVNFMITEDWKRYLDDSKSSQNIIR
jgi:hypothetical protein